MWRTGVCAFLIASGLACQPLYKKDRPYTVYEQDPSFFQPLINPAGTEEQAISLIDKSYPIEIKLFDDGRFYYDLPKLGDGWGTWQHKEGYLDLYAERKLFVMQMGIHSLDPQKSEAVALEFSDRFGAKYLKMELK